MGANNHGKSSMPSEIDRGRSDSLVEGRADFVSSLEPAGCFKYCGGYIGCLNSTIATANRAGESLASAAARSEKCYGCPVSTASAEGTRRSERFRKECLPELLPQEHTAEYFWTGTPDTPRSQADSWHSAEYPFRMLTPLAIHGIHTSHSRAIG